MRFTFSVLLQPLVEVVVTVTVTSAWDEIAPIRKTASFRKNDRMRGKAGMLYKAGACVESRKSVNLPPTLL